MDVLKCGRKSKAETEQRTVYIAEANHPGHAHYANNITSTTKYTLLTYLPKSLFEQYRRLANIYFTLVAALSLTEYSPVSSPSHATSSWVPCAHATSSWVPCAHATSSWVPGAPCNPHVIAVSPSQPANPPRLYRFTGNMVLSMDPRGGQDMKKPVKVPISAAQVILRGCSLRNTPFAYGVAIYAGHDTKVFKNASKAPSKRSFVERNTDKIIIFMFGILLAMVIVSMVFLGIWAVVIASMVFLGCYLIPISLYVSIEVVKIAQSVMYIGQDREMYHRDTDTPALARTSNLNEELGMVGLWAWSAVTRPSQVRGRCKAAPQVGCRRPSHVQFGLQCSTTGQLPQGHHRSAVQRMATGAAPFP
ncbi:hypothetical protein DUNSADRAFT_457 [Dunaliella salina]|uniref:P-type ATPase N-terminal domain-containing protein n=1 Tax=Dunaliella salina TaxID=3046 RepID=A0ABQ7GYA0_DUNSA|nr:hypothetical protein DUNSADRAFT_457 [Dunaliella salina]|eukprot:KAF5839582.1 hypothetical protein DUNSADRAFT_457 [Dunaliella salina]